MAVEIKGSTLAAALRHLADFMGPNQPRRVTFAETAEGLEIRAVAGNGETYHQHIPGERRQ